MKIYITFPFLFFAPLLCMGQFAGGNGIGDDVGTATGLLFTGSSASPTSIVILSHPSNTTVWKDNISTIVDVVGSNNLQMGGSNTVTLSLASNPGSASLVGTTSSTTTDGRAIFSGLYLDKSGNGYTLSAALSGLNSDTSNSFDVAAASLLIKVEPPVVTYANQVFRFSAKVVDGNGNILSFANPSLNVSLSVNPSSSTLSGTTTVVTSGGICNFSDLSINNIGIGYILEVSNPEFNPISTRAFDVFSSALFRGGSADGAEVDSLNSTLPVSGHIYWVGGLGSSNTDWNDALNWLPNTAVPGISDRIAIQNNGNGHNPILDQDRTVYSLNFNGSNKLLELGSYNLTLVADATGTNANNYFKTNGSGKLKRVGVPNNEGFTFPVGNSTYNPVTITNRTGAADDFSVRVLDEIYSNGLNGTPLNDARVKRTWDIDKLNPTANSANGVDFTFNWNSSEVSSPAPQVYTLFHHDSNNGGWSEVVSGLIDPFFNPAAKSMIWTGYKGSFSPFGIGDQNAPLPVELLYFNGTCQPQGLDFRWATAAEVNSQSFTLEHSTNLSDWQALHTQAAAGFSSSQKNYSAQLPANKNYGPYFRLHQQDFDGKFENFPPLHLECSGTFGSGLLLYPNPARDAVWVSGIVGTLDWKIFDARGRLLRSGQLNMDMEAQQLPTHGLPAGLYLFQTPNARLPLMLQD